MKSYSVYFSYYSEQYGEFQETHIPVQAENQFEARRLAWGLSESRDDLKFASNIKLSGIVWGGSPLELQDYFNAEASFEKYRLRNIENVEIPNAKIGVKPTERYEREKMEHYGSLHTISRTALDFGKPYGMLPPTIYDELHYTREFLSLLTTDYEKYNALSKLIERAEKWDASAMHSLKESFQYGHFTVDGIDLNFSKQYDKNGLYPDRADLTDHTRTYIRRWQNATKYKTLAQLPFFGERDVIAGSHAMQYDFANLVLKKRILRPEYEMPVNSLWTTTEHREANFATCGDWPILARNLFTDKVIEFRRSDFVGVLLPEKSANIDYEAIREEYNAQKNAENSTARDENSEDEDWGAEQ